LESEVSHGFYETDKQGVLGILIDRPRNEWEIRIAIFGFVGSEGNILTAQLI
jgi:hypothetical protein